MRANGKCGPHDVMWKRKHPSRRKVPKRRGVKPTRDVPEADARSPHLAALLATLQRGPFSLAGLADEYGRSRGKTSRALRQLEASGCKVEKRFNPDNGREVLRLVTSDEAQRYLKTLEGRT